MLGRAFLIWMIVFSFCACAPQTAKQPDTSLPRPAPGYIHWLQKQSLLHQAPEIIAQVSQSSRVWLQGAEPRRADVLLKAAPNWLQLDAANARPPIFTNTANLASVAPKMGFNGIYLGDTGEKPDIWLEWNGSNSGLRSASFQFDPAFGSEEDFARLAQAAGQAGLELGSSLLPAAAGAGPDFVLQARNAASHAGLYAMLPVPPEALPLLPKAGNEADSQALDAATITALADQGVIPARLARDAAAYASPGGWAATGPATGADGLERRWLYRSAGTPRQPVFAWQDPSGRAERIFSAAVIRATGLLGQTLTGLHMEPLMGLEPQEQGVPSFSPGLEALDALARQIHRYGGWALQADAVPASAIRKVLEGACDFCRDDVTEALVLFGLLAADGRPVAALYRSWLASGLEIARLARGFDSKANLNPSILADNPDWLAQMEKLQAQGLPNIPISQAIPNMRENGLRQFLLAWRAGMPGLAFMPMDKADMQPEPLLLARRQAGLASGRVLQVMRGHGGGFGLLSSLPNGGFWLLACNFGINADELNFTLPQKQASARDAATGEDLASGLNGQNFRIALDGRAARNVLFLQNQ